MQKGLFVNFASVFLKNQHYHDEAYHIACSNITGRHRHGVGARCAGPRPRQLPVNRPDRKPDHKGCRPRSKTGRLLAQRSHRPATTQHRLQRPIQPHTGKADHVYEHGRLWRLRRRQRGRRRDITCRQPWWRRRGHKGRPRQLVLGRLPGFDAADCAAVVAKPEPERHADF